MRKQRKACASWVGDAIACGVLLITLVVVGMSQRDQLIELDADRVLPRAFGLGGDNQPLNANSAASPQPRLRGGSGVELRSVSSGRVSRTDIAVSNE